jgi:hypothetical protein
MSSPYISPHGPAGVSPAGLDPRLGAPPLAGNQPPEVNKAHHPEELLHGNTDPPDDQQE